MKLEKSKTLFNLFYKESTTLITEPDKFIPIKGSYRPIFHTIVDLKDK